MNCAQRAVFLSALAAVPSALCAQSVEHVFHISVDGLRADTLSTLVATDPTNYPNFLRLQTQGAFTYNARTDFDFTETVPNHVSIITGRPALQPPGLSETIHHGIVTNFPASTDTIHDDGNDQVPYKQSTFDVVHDRGLKTGLYVGKARLAILERSYNAIHGAADTIGADDGRDKIDRAIVRDSGTNPHIAALTSNAIADNTAYTFLHVVEPDSAGHANGFASTQYINSIRVTDQNLGALFSFIDSNPAFSGKSAIVLTADHGGGDESQPNNHTNPTHPEHYTIPFFVWAPGFEGGSNLYSHLINRADPGDARPTYAAENQPLRNGDSANLALQLLGLPDIPGSFMQPRLIVRVVAGTGLNVPHIRRRTLDVRGTLSLAASGDGDSPDANGVSVIDALTLGPDGRIDLNNNGLILKEGDLTAVRQALITGRNAPLGGVANGAWNGPRGIMSSAAAARSLAENKESRSVGYALNSALPLGAYASFMGQEVDPTDILIRYTRNGDANLDGVVNNNDITILAGNYRPGAAGKHWYQADFNYDGFVDNNDITILAGFYNPTQTPLFAAPAETLAETFAAVPEPSAAAVLIACALFARRRRR